MDFYADKLYIPGLPKITTAFNILMIYQEIIEAIES